MKHDPQLLEVLRRAHPQELGGLCAILGVDGAALGHDRLIATLDTRLRRAGGHEALNLLRGGGPPYAAVVRWMARKLGAATTGDVAAVELGVAKALFARRWRDLSAEERRAFWVDQLGARSEPPLDGTVAMDTAHAQVGAAFAARLSGVIVAARPASLRQALWRVAWLPLVGPVAPGAALLLALSAKPHRVGPAVVEVLRLRQIIAHRVVVGVVGPPSSGKDAAIRALFGIDTGGVDPVAGSTATTTILPVPHAPGVLVVNTPGVGDVEERLTAQARAFVHHLDLVLFLVNAQGGVRTEEAEEVARLVALGRPVLVCLTKIDTLREHDRERMRVDTAAKLGLDVVTTAFDPLPALSGVPLGVDDVRAWLVPRLGVRGEALLGDRSPSAVARDAR